MNTELHPLAKKHAAMCQAIAAGEQIDMDAFQWTRAQLRERGKDDRVATGLREVKIRHLLPEEPPDKDVELAELTAAYGEWMRIRLELHQRLLSGEADDDVAIAALHAAYERHDFAKQRVDAMMYGWRIPRQYVPIKASDYVVNWPGVRGG